MQLIASLPLSDEAKLEIDLLTQNTFYCVMIMWDTTIVGDRDFALCNK